ncbi:MAG: hypothetical protein ACKOCX_02030 [Planctomycetota bacterium]
MSSAAPSRQRPPLRIVAGSSVVEFIWDGDRWRHELITAAGRWRSVEGPLDGTGDSRWPESPVLVEVSLTTLAGGSAVLGVGLAGRSHFSLSAAACPGVADTILFEAACRIHEAPAWLGSTYRAADGRIVRISAAAARPPATVAWSYTIGPRGVEAAAPRAGSAPG